MKPHDIILEAGRFYHIYNRGINGTNLFYEERNYRYFLQKYAYYMCDVVDTYAYCLLKNHFHLLIKVKEDLPDPSGFENLPDPSGLQGPSGFENLPDPSGLQGPSGFENLPDPSGLRDLTGLNKNLTGLNKGLNKGLHTPEHIISKKFSDLFNAYSKSINKVYNRTGGLFETPFKRILVSDDTYLNQLVWYIHSNPEKHGFVADFKDYPHSSYHSLLTQKSTKLAREEAIRLFGNAEAYVQYHTIKQTESGFNHLVIEFD